MTSEHEHEFPEPGPRSTVADVVRYAVGSARSALVADGPAVLAGDDPEAVHRARVATRRLRSDLRSLGPLLDPGAVDELRSELRWVGELLGAVRDLDVLDRSIRAELAAVGETPASPNAAALLDRLAVDRLDRLRVLRAAMAGERYQELLDRLASAAARPPVRPGTDGTARARRSVPVVAGPAWDRVRRPLRHLSATPPPDAVLHEVRKRAKRARYAAELTAPLVGDSGPGFAREMRRYQDLLGRLQDGVAAQRWLESVAAGQADAPVTFLAGKLWARFELVKVGARARFLGRWHPERSARRARWFT